MVISNAHEWYINADDKDVDTETHRSPEIEGRDETKEERVSA